MCGIIGLHLRSQEWEPELGSLASGMLEAMTDRGPDSSGIAIYSEDAPGGSFKYSLRAPNPAFDWEALAARFGSGFEVRHRGPDAVLVGAVPPETLLPMVRAAGVQPVSWGETLEVFKDVGSPREICDRYGIRARSGYQAVGHTRMATESAVTTAHSHPFSPASDLCLVHNGSFSNYFTVRRDLEAEGEVFDTDNDSEVGARLIARQLSEGADLGQALKTLMATLDGFFTLLVSTKDQFAVVRDAAACKPAAIAESDDYVAMASEYRALAGLPGIEKAKVFEPMPEEIHLWSR